MFATFVIFCILQKGVTLKSSTSPVRNAYILCMNAAFHGMYCFWTISLPFIIHWTINPYKDQKLISTKI